MKIGIFSIEGLDSEIVENRSDLPVGQSFDGRREHGRCLQCQNRTTVSAKLAPNRTYPGHQKAEAIEIITAKSVIS